MKAYYGHRKTVLAWTNRDAVEHKLDFLRRHRTRPGEFVVFKRTIAFDGVWDRLSALKAGINLSEFARTLVDRGNTITYVDRRRVKGL